MRIFLIAAGTKMPGWVQQGYQEYAKRLPRECALQLVEVAAAKRGRSVDIQRAAAEEGQRLLTAVPKNALTIALDGGGKEWTTEQLAEQLRQWMGGGRDVALLVGGADGLAPQCKEEAERVWSLSPLTLPHPLVRVVLAEQLYRAWSILMNRPYHRG